MSLSGGSILFTMSYTILSDLFFSNSLSRIYTYETEGRLLDYSIAVVDILMIQRYAA